MKMWKVYNNNNDLYTNDDANNDDNENNNDDEQRTNFDKKGLLELKIIKIWYIINFTLLCINTFIFDAYRYLYFSCHWPQYIVTHTDLWKLDFELLIWSFINSQFFIIQPIKTPSFGQILLQIILIHFDDKLLIGTKPSTNIRLWCILWISQEASQLRQLILKNFRKSFNFNEYHIAWAFYAY